MEDELPDEHLPRIACILSLLNQAKAPADLDIKGFGFDAFGGKRKGTYSMRVSGLHRITFRFDGEDVTDVDFEEHP